MTLDAPRPYAEIVQLHQHLMEMLPRGWRAVDLDVERGAEVVRVTKLDVEAAAPGSMPPFLGVEAEAAVAEINAVFGALARSLGAAWSGTHARFDRGHDAAELVLLDDARQVQSRFALAPDLLDDLVVSDALFDALDRTHAEFDAKQAEFDGQIRGFRRWGFDQDTGELSFVLADESPIVGRGVIVGSWAKDEGSWLWGWANESVAEESRRAVSMLRDGASDGRGLAALRTPSFSCRLPFAAQLALLGAHRLGADGLFAGSHPGGVAFVAAMP